MIVVRIRDHNGRDGRRCHDLRHSQVALQKTFRGLSARGYRIFELSPTENIHELGKEPGTRVERYVSGLPRPLQQFVRWSFPEQSRNDGVGVEDEAQTGLSALRAGAPRGRP